MSKDTHCQKILAWLEHNGSITAMDAISFGCTRLAARIADLKKRGYVIVADRVSGINADGKPVVYARYRFD